jgi:hypothetical protein
MLLLFLAVGRSLAFDLVDTSTALEKVCKDGHVLIGLIGIFLIRLVVGVLLRVGIRIIGLSLDLGVGIK